MEYESSVPEILFFSHPSGQNFEVASNTKIKDLVRTIATNLMLSSAEGFSLFVKTPDKVCTRATMIYIFNSHGCKHIQDLKPIV